MRTTFSGFEIAKSGIQSAETGLDVTGQNISKMNTAGYSRQTVEQSAVYYDTSSYKYAPVNKAVVGQGVTVDHIKQIRDDFLDSQYRTANSESGELSKTYSILSNVEGIFDETQTDGLGAKLEELYKNLQTLSANTGDIEYAGLVRSAAKKVTESLNYYYQQLETVRSQEEYDLSVTVDDVNTLLTKIDKMNQAIQVETLNGHATNDLLDTRNTYLDKLSESVGITVVANSDGTVSVKVGSQYLINAANGTVATVSLNNSSGSLSVVTDSGELALVSGAIKGYLDSLNGKGAYAASGENSFNGIPYYEKALDDFAKSFAETFNTLNGTGKPLFEGDTASTISLSAGWQADANYITASNLPGSTNGANENILKMISVLDSSVAVSPNFTGTFDEFVTSLISDIATDTKYASDLKDTSDKVLSSINNQRESVKGVSLNEETVNLLKYQKAFEASSRVITVLDEMLDIIINRMGTVGR